jgi:hypothetical protein
MRTKTSSLDSLAAFSPGRQERAVHTGTCFPAGASGGAGAGLNDSTSENQLLKAVLAAFGTFAAFVAAIYVFGGCVLYLRLQIRGLRTDAVVSSLPREFLISVGLSVLVQLVPYLLLLLGAYIQEARLPLDGDHPNWANVLRASLVGAATLILALPTLRWIGWDRWPWLLVAFWLADATAAVLWLILERFVNKCGRLRFKNRSLRVKAGLLTLIAFLIFVPWRVALERASIDSLSALVCTTDSSNNTIGLFIGANGERVYIGEKLKPHRIAEIPRSEIKRLYIGASAEEVPCPSSLDSFTLNPAQVRAGSVATGTVRLKGRAPDGGMAVILTSSNPSVALLQRPHGKVQKGEIRIKIRKDRGTAFFPINTDSSVDQMKTVVISAFSKGVTKTASLKVTAG